jgi:hypothetical protein
MPSNHPVAQSFGDGLGFKVHMQLLVNAPHIPRDSARTDAGAPSHPVLAFADTSSWNDTNGHGRTDRCVAVYRGFSSNTTPPEFFPPYDVVP